MVNPVEPPDGRAGIRDKTDRKGYEGTHPIDEPKKHRRARISRPEICMNATPAHVSSMVGVERCTRSDPKRWKRHVLQAHSSVPNERMEVALKHAWLDEPTDVFIHDGGWMHLSMLYACDGANEEMGRSSRKGTCRIKPCSSACTYVRHVARIRNLHVHPTCDQMHPPRPSATKTLP